MDSSQVFIGRLATLLLDIYDRNWNTTFKKKKSFQLIFTMEIEIQLLKKEKKSFQLKRKFGYMVVCKIVFAQVSSCCVLHLLSTLVQLFLNTLRISKIVQGPYALVATVTNQKQRLLSYCIKRHQAWRRMLNAH